jgi:hypothetical protein
MPAFDGNAVRVKVPVGVVASLAYRTVFTRLGRIFDLGWLPILVLLALDILPGLVALPEDGIADAIDVGRAAASMLCFAAIAVRWYHALLLPEEGAVSRLFILRGWMRFAAWWLALSCVALAPFAIAVLGLATGIVAADDEAAILALAAVAIAATLAANRCSLLLPAAALGRPLGLGAAWRLMRGNTWRLVGATLLVMMPALAVLAIVMRLLVSAAPLDPTAEVPAALSWNLVVLSGIVDVLFGAVIVTLGASILSEFYRRIVPAG